MAFHSTQGPQLGLPQMIQSRPQFGYAGALLVWVVALIAYIGYNAFNQVLCAQALHQLSATIAPDSTRAIVLFALSAASLAAVGYDKIHLAQRGFAYLMIAILTVFTVGALFMLRFPAEQFRWSGFRAVPFLAQLFAAASYQLSWSIYVSDYSRYLPRDVGTRESFWWTYLGAFIGGTWMMLVGTVAAAAYPKLDVAAAMQTAADGIVSGLGNILLVGSLLGLVTISALNFYGASLTLLSVADTLKPLRCTAGKRLASVAAAALASTALALMSSGDFINRFGDFLSLLLYLFTPWTAINLVDFYWVRKCHYSIREIFNPRGMYGRWNWRGLLAYGVGFAAMIPFFSTAAFKGPVARALGGADIAMLIGLPVSAVVYLLACRSMDIEDDRRKALTADLTLEA
jgi:purine-cytosine permease-like protein